MAEEERRERRRRRIRTPFGVVRQMKRDFKDMFPQEFWEHRREARKEMLLACRSLIDAAIENLEEESRRKPTKIEVE